MTFTMTREQAAAAEAVAIAERDGIQANLLDLDGSFGKRMLAGAELTGVSKQRWERTASDLATLWDIFTAYAAVVDKAAELLASSRRLDNPELAQITSMLNGPSVELTRAPAPLARRDLTDRGRAVLTLPAAVAEMKRTFASVTEVVTAAENVWNQTADGLTDVATAIGTASEQAAGLGDDELTSALAAAQAELGLLRGVLRCDPLALWQDGRVDTSRLDRLRTGVNAAAARVSDLARLRADAQQRISAVTAAVLAAAAAWQDAVAARGRAVAKIAASDLPPAPIRPPGLEERLAGLETLKASGRWDRLAAELDAVEKEIAADLRRSREAERAATGALGKRNELRGMLDAYQAKAARLGAAEDMELNDRYQQAQDLLWTAPCDLTAAEAAVMGYQQAIVALSRRRQPQ